MNTCRWDFISLHRNEFGVQRLRRILGVHRSAYYKWLAGAPARQARAVADADLIAAIREQHAASLKRELLYGTRWATSERARLDVFGWIAFYNNVRLHSTLGYVSPAAYEKRNAPTTVLALAA